MRLHELQKNPLLEKMDLLRQILARLPIQRISDLSHSDSNVLLCIRNRLRVVNYLSEDYLTNLQGAFGGSSFAAYLALCAFQGELFSDSDRHISSTLVCSRAIFLRDRVAFRHALSGADVDKIDIDLALASKDEHMIFPLLDTNSRSCFRVIDPEIVDWKPAVVQRYHARLSRYSSREYTRDMAALAGYLHLPAIHLTNPSVRDIHLGRSIPVYWRSYFLSALAGETDHFIDRPDLNAKLAIIEKFIMTSVVEKICVYAGYFPPRLLSGNVAQLQRLAIRYVQPALLERLYTENTEVQFKLPKVDNLKITHSLARRARQMVAVIDRLYPVGRGKYRTAMEAIGGLPIRGQIDSDVRQIMRAVAHPEWVEAWRVFGTPSTVIHYDLAQKIDPFGRFSALRMTYIEGKLLQRFRADEMEKLRSAMKYGM